MKKNILIYVDKWDNGGIESLVMDYFKYLDLTKANFYILTSQIITTKYHEDLTKMNISIESTGCEGIDNPIKRIWTNLSKIEKKIAERKYDIVHLHLSNGAVLKYAEICKKLNVKKVIVHSHSSNINSKNKLIKLLMHKFGVKNYNKYVDVKIACSNKAGESMFENSKYYFLKNGIDLNKYKFDIEKRKEIKEYLKSILIKNNKEYESLKAEELKIIGHIGRFSTEKNHEYILKILKYMKDNNKLNKKIIFLLIGNGTLEKEIKEKSKKIGVNENIIFLGGINNVEEYLNSMDVFILPSKFEGNPISVVEAQANGLKVFLSDTITNQAKLLDSTEYIPITEEKIRIWTEKILDYEVNLNNRYTYSILEKKGYEIKDIVNELKEIYEI